MNIDHTNLLDALKREAVGVVIPNAPHPDISDADITAEAAWAPVKFPEGTQIGLTADGTKLVIPVPAAAQSGFMILQYSAQGTLHSALRTLHFSSPHSALTLPVPEGEERTAR